MNHGEPVAAERSKNATFPQRDLILTQPGKGPVNEGLLFLDSRFLPVVGDVRQRGRTRAGAEGRVQGCQRGDGRDDFLRGSSEDGAAAVVRVRGGRGRRGEARVQAPETQQRYCTSIAMSFWGYIIIMYQQYCLS